MTQTPIHGCYRNVVTAELNQGVMRWVDVERPGVGPFIARGAPEIRTDKDHAQNLVSQLDVQWTSGTLKHLGRRGITLPATVPPSTGNTVPVTYLERSPAK